MSLLIVVVFLSIVSDASARAMYVTLTSDGVARGAVVDLPSTYNANQRFPVLLVFHPSNGTGAGMERTTGLDAQADRLGFVVVYPDSIGPQWDTHGTSDLRFVPTLLVTLSSQFSLDPQRVYLSGYSDGGGLAQKLACTQANAYAGLATVGTNMADDDEAQCQPSQPLTYLSFHGTADPIVPYDGGPVNGPYAMGRVTNATSQVAAFWAGLEGCTAARTNASIPDKLATGADVVDQVVTAPHCRKGVSVTLYTIPGGGHTWPGGTQMPTSTNGDVSKELNASAIILETMGPHRSAARNVCFEGATLACPITNGAGAQSCVGGQPTRCVVASCKSGFVPRGGACVADRK